MTDTEREIIKELKKRLIPDVTVRWSDREPPFRNYVAAYLRLDIAGIGLKKLSDNCDSLEDLLTAVRSLPQPAKCKRCGGSGLVRERSEPENAALGTFPCPECETDEQRKPGCSGRETISPWETDRNPPAETESSEIFCTDKYIAELESALEAETHRANNNLSNLAQLAEIAESMEVKCQAYIQLLNWASQHGLMFTSAETKPTRQLLADFAAFRAENPELFQKEDGDGTE